MFQQNLRITRNESCSIFLSPWPILPGHLLVVANTQTRRMTDLPDSEASDMWREVRLATRLLKSWSGIEGANINCKDGHPYYERLTIHVVPRKTGDIEESDWVYPQIDNFHTHMGDEILDMTDLERQAQEMSKIE